MSKKHDQKNIVNIVALYIKQNQLIKPRDKVILALSGGPDSMCLFNILYELQGKFNFSLSACHYNHKIRGAESDNDLQFVKNFCSNRGVEVIIAEKEDFEIIMNESDARELRYAFFEKILQEKGREGAKIALAHNLNDLAETYIMRLLRGSGLKGLSSILPQRKNFIRPLLQVSKLQILEYLKFNSIDYVIDSTNNCDTYFRNHIRNNLIPELEKYNPKAIESIARAAVITARDYSILDELVVKAYEKYVKVDKNRHVISREDWKKIDVRLHGYFLNYCFVQISGGKDITYSHIENIIEIIENNVGNKIIPLPHSLRFEFKNGRIYLYHINQ